MLVDIKGRKHSGRSGKSPDNWVTQADVDGRAKWDKLFGPVFAGAFAFLNWCELRPPEALFLDRFLHQDR